MHIPRTDVMNKLDSLVRTKAITLLSSPPATGKSSLLQLYAANNSFFNIKYIQCKPYHDPYQILSLEGVNFHEKAFNLPQDQWTLIILDDAQHWYGNTNERNDFWYDLQKSPGWILGDGTSIQLKFIISTTHTLTLDYPSPAGFGTLPRIKFKDLKISNAEANQLLNLNFEHHFDVSEKVREMVIRHCGGVIGAVAIFIMNIYDDFSHQANVTESEMLQYFCSLDFIDSFDRVFGTSKKVDADFATFLKHCILFGLTDDGTIPEYTKKVTELEKRGVLTRDAGEVKFSSVIAKRYYTQFFFPNRAEKCPDTLCELIKLAIGNMSSTLLNNSVVYSTHFPKETVFQHEFMSGLARSLPANNHICPELSQIFPTTGGAAATSETVNGEIDFYIHGKLHWGLELMIKGDRLNEHLERFKVGGKYYAFNMNDYRVIDFRHGEPTNVQRFEKRVTVFFPEGDFSRCVCLFGVDKTSVGISLLP